MDGRKWFKIEPIGLEDRNEVVQFLRLHFYKDEPVNQILGITDCTDEENWFCGGLADGCSFKAVNENGEIVAIKLNGLSYKDKELHLQTDDPKFQIMIDLVEKMVADYNVFTAVPDCGDRIVEGKVLTVRPDYRKQGIAIELYKHTTEWMAANGVRNMITYCSSLYTGLACQKLGYALVYQLDYADYKVDGECPILPKLPHTALRVYLTTV